MLVFHNVYMVFMVQLLKLLQANVNLAFKIAIHVKILKIVKFVIHFTI